MKEKLTLRILQEVIGKEVRKKDEIDFENNSVKIYYWTEENRLEEKDLNLDTLLVECKNWILDYRNHVDVFCSHKTFYTQSDGSDWYAGTNHIHTTYDNKAEFTDLGKGETELEAVLDCMDDFIDNKLEHEKRKSSDTEKLYSERLWEGENIPSVREEPKVGRNELCPCGSGKKYKRCCLAKS